jgi:hypothetical protein
MWTYTHITVSYMSIQKAYIDRRNIDRTNCTNIYTKTNTLSEYVPNNLSLSCHGKKPKTALSLPPSLPLFLSLLATMLRDAGADVSYSLTLSHTHLPEAWSIVRVRLEDTEAATEPAIGCCIDSADRSPLPVSVCVCVCDSVCVLQCVCVTLCVIVCTYVRV